MSQNKKAYFQGTEEPTPKKKKYKSEKAILVQPRFKEPFYSNYDLYDTEGLDGNTKLGPGAGWHSMHKYKSIKEFRDAKRKRMQDKYKADDFWIEDTASNRNQRIEKMKIRAEIVKSLIKIAIDFPIDDQINSGSITGDSGCYTDGAQLGGELDEYLMKNDFEEKSPDQLNFGRDYIEDQYPNSKLNKLQEKYIQPTEPSLYGLPDGVDIKEDLNIAGIEQSQYGVTDFGNTFYNEI